MAVQTAFSAAAQSEPEALAEECFAYITEQRGAESFWEGLEFGEYDWAAYCRARLYGADGAEGFAASAEMRVAELESSDGFVRPTEYQRAAVCIAAAGGSASHAAELGALCSERLDSQGFNAYIWALITVNVTGAQPPQNAVNTAETLSDYIISRQHEDGSFSLTGDSGDTDITAAAVYALSGMGLSAAEQAAQRGADWLCGLDSYSSMGVVNCESTAQAVIALAAAGRIETAQLAALQLSEYKKDGGYAHTADGKVNRMATVQALEAFTALALAERGESLFGALPDISENGEEAAADETAAAVCADTAETGEAAADVGVSGFTGKHIGIIISAALGAAAAACLLLFLLRRKKAALPAAVLLAALAGGVQLLDIRTPEEYYALNGGGSLHVTVSADCSAALKNMDGIVTDINPAEVIPADGAVISECEVSLPEGASAFDALAAAAREQRVRVDSSGSIYGTYVRSIGYICEFGFGELSGWMYLVNGEFPDVSAAAYSLGEGDIVEFVYTCDLGKDIRNDYADE